MAVVDTRPLRHAVLRPHQTLEELAELEAEGTFAVGAFDGEDLIAVGLVGPEEEQGWWRIRGMATAPEARGQGLGTAILQTLLDHARAHGAERVWASVRVPALSLYTRAGFRVTSEEFEPPHIGPHVMVELGLTRSPRATP